MTNRKRWQGRILGVALLTLLFFAPKARAQSFDFRTTGTVSGTIWEFRGTNIASHSASRPGWGKIIFDTGCQCFKVSANAGGWMDLVGGGGGGGGGVTSVFGRAGAVSGQAGDYTAAQVTATPFLTITGTTVQQQLQQINTRIGTVTAGVQTFQGRSGNITGVQSDYDAFFLTPAELTAMGFAPLGSPTFTGDPKAPTPAGTDNDTSIATTAYVTNKLTGLSFAPLSSPAFTGDPTAPTPAAIDNDTSVATTAYVTGKIGSLGASGIALTPTGDVAATDVQAGIAELDTDKLATADLQASADPFFLTPTEGDTLFTTPAEAAAAAPVQTIFGRSGAVTALQSDYDPFFLTMAEGSAAFVNTETDTMEGRLTLRQTGAAANSAVPVLATVADNLVIINGSTASPSLSENPMLTMLRTTAANRTGGIGEVHLDVTKTGGTGSMEALTVWARQTAAVPGGMLGIGSRVIADVAGAGQSHFGMWPTVQKWVSGVNTTGMEINVENVGAIGNNSNDYGTTGNTSVTLNLVGVSASGTGKHTAAIVVDTQNGQNASFYTGIDFRPNSIATDFNRAIRLPNNGWISSWNGGNTATQNLLRSTSTNDTVFGTGGYYYWTSPTNTTIGTLQNDGTAIFTRAGLGRAPTTGIELDVVGDVMATKYQTEGTPQTLFGVPGTSTPRQLALVDGSTAPGGAVTTSSSTISVQRVDSSTAAGTETVIPYFFSTNRKGTGTTGALYNLTGYIDSDSIAAGGVSHDIVGTAGIAAALTGGQKARAWGGFFFGQNACAQDVAIGCIAEGIEVNVLNATGGLTNYGSGGYGGTIGIDLVGLAAGTGSKYNSTALAINAGLPSSGAVSAKWVTGIAIGANALADETYAVGLDLRNIPTTNANLALFPAGGFLRWTVTGDPVHGKYIGTNGTTNGLILDTPAGNATVPTPGPVTVKVGGTTQLEAATTGVSFPTQHRVRAYASVATPATLTTGVWTAVPLDAEDFDVGNIHSTVTNNTRVTISVAGTYQMTARCAFTSNTTGDRSISIIKNGVTTLGTVKVKSSAIEGTIIQANDLNVLAVNDYIEMHAYQNSGANLNLVGAPSLCALIVARQY